MKDYSAKRPFAEKVVTRLTDSAKHLGNAGADLDGVGSIAMNVSPIQGVKMDFAMLHLSAFVNRDLLGCFVMNLLHCQIGTILEVSLVFNMPDKHILN